MKLSFMLEFDTETNHLNMSGSLDAPKVLSLGVLEMAKDGIKMYAAEHGNNGKPKIVVPQLRIGRPAQ
jgi:hypothetical protein